MKRLISMFLAMLLAISFATVGMAQEESPAKQQLRYTGLANSYASLKSEGNTLILEGGITVWDGYTCKLTIDMQERNGYSGTWYTKSTYTATGSSRDICAIEERITGTSGHSYRGYCKFQAFDASGNEVDVKYAYTTILYL